MAGNDYYISFVYGSPSLTARKNVWIHLSQLMSSNQGRWVLLGDFNQVESQNQILGGSLSIKGATNFSDWKLENKLLDIPFYGINYTWTNNKIKENAIYQRIDKAFSNENWKNMYTEASLWNLPIILSDHSPIVLHLQDKYQRKRLRPYMLDTWYRDHPDILNIVQEEWGKYFHGSSSHILQRNFKIH